MSIHIIDLSIFILYLVFMLGVDFFFLRKNKSDYYQSGSTIPGFIRSKLEVPYGLDPIIVGLTASGLCYMIISKLNNKKQYA